ncbi:MAG: cyclic pyranopterin monophosphate synthase MoaC [Acidimicrobiia bacterium]|nr:cyclic pyranopterin monophosphate synthase MoaC [Acidimicrobiia bacterium]
MTSFKFTHLDDEGNARMVDVTEKEVTHRRARARGRVHMEPATAEQIAAGGLAKGDVLAVARVAAIQAAKQTANLIPLCHPLRLGSITVDFAVGATCVEIEVVVEAVDRTGVEMEALTAVSVAALTIYDMAKAVDKEMVIGEIALWEKDGGRSGAYRRTN